MPFINSKISLKVTKEKEEILKSRLGKAIELIPEKSEEWLMLGFEDGYKLYFIGQELGKGAFINVKIFGTRDKENYDKLTQEICKIFDEVLDIPSDKIFITYDEVEVWGWNKVNF